MRVNLAELLREAREGYARHGRGAVVIDDRATPGPAGHWRDRSITFYYYSNRQAVGSNNGWPTKDIHKMVREYNPDKQAVCVFLLPGRLCAGYRIWDAKANKS